MEFKGLSEQKTQTLRMSGDLYAVENSTSGEEESHVGVCALMEMPTRFPPEMSKE